MRAKNLITGVFLFCSAVVLSCDANADLVEDGKWSLIEDKDVYAADAKFAAALDDDDVTNDEKARFWRAVTIQSSNPNLKQTLIDLKLISSTDNKQLVVDKENEMMATFTTVDTVIIDNKDSGYSETGSDWQTYNAGKDTFYDTDCRVHTAGTGSNIASWTPNINRAGEYNVDVWWPYTSTNARNAKYTVYYDGGSQTFQIDQSRNFQRWHYLGKFKFSPGQQARLELSDNASSGQVAADAVRLEYDGEYISEDQTVLTGDWQTITGKGGKDGSYKEIASGSGGSCVWQPNIPTTGKYQIEAYWTEEPGNATDAVFTISPSGKTSTQITVNQQKETGFHFAMYSLGLYDLQQGTDNIITLSQSATGKVTTDGLRITQVQSNYPKMDEAQQDVSSGIAEIDEALTLLNDVTTAFSDTADIHDKDTNGNRILTEFDYGDILMAKANLCLQKAWLNLFYSYDLDNIDGPELASTYEKLLTINYVFDKYPDLEKLIPEAPTRLTNAKLALIESIDFYQSGYDFITGEIDSQEDDFITFEERDREETDYIKSKLAELKENLEATRSTLTETSDDIIKMGMDRDLDESYYKITFNMREFFDNPKVLRDLKPEFGSDDRPLRSTTPDPTFGSVLPDMAQAELNGLYQLGSCLFQPLVLWTDNSVSIKLEWKLDTYSDFTSYKLYRSTTDDVNENSSLVYETTDKNTLAFTDTSVDPGIRIYYYRLYTYYSDGDVIGGNIRRVSTKTYVDINNTTGTEDGSPQHPYRLLRDAIENTYSGKLCVSQGTYNENEVTLRYFRGLNNLVLEGGYETTNWNRDIETYPTIIDGTGLGGWSVLGIYNKTNVTIDGFKITGPQNNAVELNYSKGITIRNCTLTSTNGVGIGMWNSSLNVENCSIIRNKMDGVLVSSNSSITISESCVSENQGYGIQIRYSSSTTSTTLQNNLINANNGVGIHLQYTLDKVMIKNNIIEGNKIFGISCNSNDSPVITNNTIINNSTWAIAWSSGAIGYNLTPKIKDNIITGHSVGIHFESGTGSPTIDYNDVWNNTTNYSGCSAGIHDISSDPLFTNGLLGSYYLSQTASGQATTSPCVDAGSDTALNLGLQDLTTRTDRVKDTDIVDLGYHYSTNRAPVLGTIGNKMVDENVLLEFTISAVDSDGDALIYSAINLPSGASFDCQTRTFSWTPTYTQAGTYTTVTFTASDGNKSDSEVIAITVNNVNAPPQLGSIDPAIGSSDPNQEVTFTTTYSDADGWENLKYSYLLINTGISGSNGFYGYYLRGTNKLYLRDDSGTAWLDGVAPGSSNILENSYAKLDCAQTTVRGDGDTLTITWAITFKSLFTGTKNSYLRVVDRARAVDGWTNKGTWTINNQAPAIGGLEPSRGSSDPNQEVSFTTTYSDADGWENLKYSYLLINTGISGSNGFYGYYVRGTNKLYLRDDSGTAWLGGVAPGSSNILENSYAKLDCTKTKVSGSDNELTIKWNVTFKSIFTGTKNSYLRVVDSARAVDGWTKKGTWTINNQAPGVGTIEPSSGSSDPNQEVSFTTTYSDGDGWENLKYSYLLINTTANSANSVYAHYYRNSNKLYFYDYSQKKWLSGVAGSDIVLETPWAKLNCQNTTLTGDGDTLTITWAITFKSLFTGTKNSYLRVVDCAGAVNGWMKKGTWVIE